MNKKELINQQIKRCLELNMHEEALDLMRLIKAPQELYRQNFLFCVDRLFSSGEGIYFWFKHGHLSDTEYIPVINKFLEGCFDEEAYQAAKKLKLPNEYILSVLNRYINKKDLEFILKWAKLGKIKLDKDFFIEQFNIINLGGDYEKAKKWAKLAGIKINKKHCEIGLQGCLKKNEEMIESSIIKTNKYTYALPWIKKGKLKVDKDTVEAAIKYFLNKADETNSNNQNLIKSYIYLAGEYMKLLEED